MATITSEKKKYPGDYKYTQITFSLEKKKKEKKIYCSVFTKPGYFLNGIRDEYPFYVCTLFGDTNLIPLTLYYNP